MYMNHLTDSDCHYMMETFLSMNVNHYAVSLFVLNYYNLFFVVGLQVTR